jgi:polar amino acid transport system substrate-binding protein
MTPRLLRRALCLIFSTALSTGLSAATDAPPDKVYSLAFYQAGLLYSQGKGLDRDVIDELMKRGGYRFDTFEQPRARIWKELQEGTLSMTVSAIRVAERDSFAYFIPYHAQKNMALTTRADLRSPADLLADPRARIAVVRSFRHGPTYDELIAQLAGQGRVIKVPSIHNLFLMLGAGNRVDTVFSLPLFYRKELAELGLEDRVRIMDWSPRTAPIPHHLALSKAHFSYRDYQRMAALMQGMRDDGTLRRLLSAYLSGDELESALQF